MAKDLSYIFGEIDRAMRDSQWQKAKALLLSLKRANLNSEEVIRFAALCCRANIPGLGICKLRPIVRPTSRKGMPATPLHLVEYARCLVRLGACPEAEGILSQIKNADHPDAYQVWGALHLQRWDYHLAVPVYKSHIAAIPAGSYQSTVSKLNLSMALIFEEQFNEAAVILNEIIATQENCQFKILKGNCYRFFGVLEMNRGHYDVALQCLQQAYSTLKDAEGLDPFLVRKSMAITQYFAKKASPEAKSGLDAILEEALTRKLWESVRDIEYHTALFHKDEKALTKLYFGTPFPHFKESLRKKFPTMDFPGSYNWILGKPSAKKIKLFELDNSGIKPGQSFYRLLSVLLSDFYRAFNTVDLYQGVFPGEFYRYGNSEQRVHQVLSRLRTELKKEKLPFEIDSEDGLFRLSSRAPIEIVVKDITRTLQSQTDHRIEKLKELFSNRPFSIREVVSTFQVSRTTAKGIIKDGIDSGVLQKQGSGNKVLYQLVDPSLNEIKKAA